MNDIEERVAELENELCQVRELCREALQVAFESQVTADSISLCSIEDDVEGLRNDVDAIFRNMESE